MPLALPPAVCEPRGFSLHCLINLSKTVVISLMSGDAAPQFQVFLLAERPFRPLVHFPSRFCRFLQLTSERFFVFQSRS